MPTTACPTCHHSDAHTALIGCLHQDGTTFCDCQATWAPHMTLADAYQERDIALERVHSTTDVQWANKAIAVIQTLVADGDFSSDDVWDALTDAQVPAPAEPRALGPVIQRMVKAGTIQPLGFTPSRRRHGAPIRTYTRTYSGSRTA